jgi:hypothetical protein
MAESQKAAVIKADRAIIHPAIFCGVDIAHLCFDGRDDSRTLTNDGLESRENQGDGGEPKNPRNR